MILGAFLVYVGVSIRGVWLALIWFGVSLWALSIGYLGIGAKVLGKSKSGAIAPWARLLHLPFLLYARILWHATRLISREAPFHVVSDDLLIGRRLVPYEMPRDIKNYVDLTAELEDPPSVKNDFNYICLPILDGYVPKAKELSSAISRLQDGRTYVHCAQGHGRTGLFTLALLAERHMINGLGAGVSLLKSVRPGLRLNSLQIAFLRNYLNGITLP